MGATGPTLSFPDFNPNDTDTGDGPALTTTDKPKTGSASGQGALLNAQTALKKWEDEQERLKTGSQAQATYLTSQMGAGIPQVTLDNISGQETAGQGYINTQYDALLKSLTGRRDEGVGFTTTGFDALKNYLATNAPQAYAQAQTASPVIAQNALAQYMANQGVNPATVQPALNEASAQSTGAANNFNQLLNVLRAQEISGQGSRQAEEQMARSLGLSGIQQTYGQATSGLEQGKLSALNELATRISNARLQAQQVQTTRDQSLQDAIGQLIGTGYLGETFVPTPSTGGDGTGGDGTGGDGTGGGGTGEVKGVVPTAGYSIKNGALVANLGKNAPGADAPSKAELAARPTALAGVGLHWEWNGAKWVKVPNRK